MLEAAKKTGTQHWFQMLPVSKEEFWLPEPCSETPGMSLQSLEAPSILPPLLLPLLGAC